MSKKETLNKHDRRKIENARTEDLNHVIIKDSHGRSTIRKIVHSHVVLNFALILVQMVVFFFFLFRLQQHIEYYFAFSILLSSAFMIYISNRKGKNEFKIAWLFPVALFPLFGVPAYFMYHLNAGELRLKRRLKYLKGMSNVCLPNKLAAEETLRQFPEAYNIGHYLLAHENYYPHTDTVVEYFASGEEFFPDFMNTIRNAKKFIFIEFFIVDIDETWATLVELLEQKVQEGVEVRVLYDGVGSPVASQRFYLKYLREKGIKVHPFLPLIPFFSTQQNNRDHRKIVIVDGEVAYTGGVNISNEYMNRGKNRFAYWKDNAIRVEGPAIQNFMVMFLQTWNVGTDGEDEYSRFINFPYKKHDAEGLVIPYGDDAYNNEDIAENVYLHIISNARKYLYITTPYVIIDNQMQEALIFAAKRGVDVKIIVPSVPDHFITFCVGKTFINTLVKNGIEVYTYEKGFIHEKTFISDDKFCTVGSVNLDYRSLFYHFECGALMYKTSVIPAVKKDFENTLTESTKMDKSSYKKIPAYKRAIGRLFRVFAPLI